jgi:hypothetical protein
MKSEHFLKEGFVEDASDVHADHEVQMARSDLFHAAEDALVLHKLLRNVSEQQGLEGWVAAKITLASDYLKTVREYIEYELMSAASEQPMLPIAEGSGSKEKQKTPYRDINSPEHRAAADKQKQQMAKDAAAEPGKKLADKIAKKDVSEGSVTKKPQPYNDPHLTKKLSKKQLDALAGPKYKKDKKEQGVAEGVARSFDPQLIEILKQRGFKGPMAVGRAKKWIPAVKEVAANGNFSIGADDIIMVSGSDPDYDPWVLYVPKVGKYIYNEGMAYNLLTAKQVVKFTVPKDDDDFFEGVAEGEYKSRHIHRQEQNKKYDEYRRNQEAQGKKPLSRGDWAATQRKGQEGVAEAAKWRQGYRASGHPPGYQHKSGEIGPLGGTYDTTSNYGDEVKVPVNRYRDEPDRLADREKTKLSTSGKPLTAKNAARNLKTAIRQAKGRHGPVGVLPEQGVVEGSSCNMTMEGKSCPMHGLKECPGYKSSIEETTAGSVAGVVNPTPKNKAKVGTLFGGTYKQKKTK